MFGNFSVPANYTSLEGTLATSGTIHTVKVNNIHSCSVGDGGGRAENFANTLSILLPTHKIYAAERPIARGDLLVTRFQTKPNGDIISQYQIDRQQVIKTHREPYRILEFSN